MLKHSAVLHRRPLVLCTFRPTVSQLCLVCEYHGLLDGAGRQHDPVGQTAVQPFRRSWGFTVAVAHIQRQEQEVVSHAAECKILVHETITRAYLSSAPAVMLRSALSW